MKKNRALLALAAILVSGLFLAGCSLGDDPSNGGGGNGGGSTPYSIRYYAGVDAAEPGYSPEFAEGTAVYLMAGSAFSRTGYTFSNWTDARDGTGASYSAGSYFRAGDAPWTAANPVLEMFAVWTLDPTDPEVPGPTEIDPFFWGSWIRMPSSNSEEWYISHASLTQGGYSFGTVTAATADRLTYDCGSVAYTITRTTDNQLKVDDGDGDTTDSFNLIRRSGQMTSASLGVVLNTAASGSSQFSRGASSLAGIKVILQNSKNSKDRREQELPAGTAGSPDAAVSLDGLIAGDTYDVSVIDGDGATATTAEVVPLFDGQDLGNVTVTDSTANFKIGYSIAGSPKYLFAGETYTLYINVSNTGSAKMEQAKFEITEPSGMTLSNQDTGSSLSDILGSVEPRGAAKTIALNMTVSSFTEVKRSFDIPVRIWSPLANGLEWNDNVNILAYGQRMDLYICTKENYMNGMIITPDKQFISFYAAPYSTYVSVPYVDQPYTLALSGADYSSETKYVISPGESYTPAWQQFTDPTLHEPNETEEQTIPVFLDSHEVGYLGVNDIDFFRIYPVNKDESVLFDLGEFEDLSLAVSNSTLMAGSAAVATVSVANALLAAGGSGWQWFVDGEPVPGQTGSTLEFSAASRTPGFYLVAVFVEYGGIQYSAETVIEVTSADVLRYSFGSATLPAAFSGSWYAADGVLRSPETANGGTSQTECAVTLAQPSTVSFSYGGETEAYSGDRIRFYIDGTEQTVSPDSPQTDGAAFSSAWSMPAGTLLPAGAHSFRFAYTKNYGGSYGKDYVWIDNLTIRASSGN